MTNSFLRGITFYCLVALFSVSANAALVTFDVDYRTGLGTASSIFVLDDTLLLSPFDLDSNDFESFVLTINGTGTGADGVYDLSDFDFVIFRNVNPLDPTMELLSQPAFIDGAPTGPPLGIFTLRSVVNLFDDSGPLAFRYDGTAPFELNFIAESITPRVVPLPGAVILFISGLGVIFSMRVK